MTIPDQSKGDRSRDEVLAGEYVLGVLGEVARKDVEARLQRDRQFAAIVQRWEENLAGFDDEYPAMASSFSHPQARIETRIFTVPAIDASSGIFSRLWHSLALWRGLALAGVAALLVVGGQKMIAGFAPQSGHSVASMSGGDGTVDLLASFDRASGVLRVTPVARGDLGRKSLELWIATDGRAPRSLGVLPADGLSELVIPTELRSQLMQGSVLTVTFEPPGGSPTGRLTGPVVASGPLGP